MMMEVEAYKRQMDTLSGQMQMVESKRMEINSTLEAMDSIRGNKAGTEILVHMGSNSFIRAELKENRRVVVGIGAGVSVEKTIDEAKVLLKSRYEELAKTLNRLQSAIVETNNKLIELDSRSRGLIQELQKSQNVPVTEEETQ